MRKLSLYYYFIFLLFILKYLFIYFRSFYDAFYYISVLPL